MVVPSWTTPLPVLSRVPTSDKKVLLPPVILPNQCAAMRELQPSCFLGKGLSLDPCLSRCYRSLLYMQTKQLGVAVTLKCLNRQRSLQELNSFPKSFLIFVHPLFLNCWHFQNSSYDKFLKEQLFYCQKIILWYIRKFCFPKFKISGPMTDEFFRNHMPSDGCHSHVLKRFLCLI